MRFSIALLSVATLLTGVAEAQTGTDRQARAWAATCAACHGTDGQGVGGIPPIGPRDADQLHRTLLEFKNGQRPSATVMHQHAKGYTDDELKRIAAVLARGASK
jgi:sulfide dehydrogenase cytochrome subunit